jgi:hypothetical protein
MFFIAATCVPPIILTALTLANGARSARAVQSLRFNVSQASRVGEGENPYIDSAQVHEMSQDSHEHTIRARLAYPVGLENFWQ